MGVAKVLLVVVADEVVWVATDFDGDGLFDEASWFEGKVAFMVRQQLLGLEHHQAILISLRCLLIM